MTDVLRPTDEGLDRAAELLASGEVVAFPTDTVYGVGVASTRRDRLDLLFAIKDRPVDKRIALLVSGLDQVREAGWEPDERALRLAERFWPGGLTIVVGAADGATQGFRVPDHAVTIDLIKRAGPIYATSANRSSEPDTLAADEVLIAFAQQQDELAAVVDGGPVPGGIGSTVVDVSTTPARVHRIGPVSREAISEVVELADG
ncbi:MAG: threonylcarbamoyl-AMP synthase [Chloroflexi bacterium]|nr:threonylcarbamoyl-AMP synthase [Chloroflexota bacterium]